MAELRNGVLDGLSPSHSWGHSGLNVPAILAVLVLNRSRPSLGVAASGTTPDVEGGPTQGFPIGARKGQEGGV